MMKQPATMADRLRRALSRIDRRLENPAYTRYARQELSDHRAALLDEEFTEQGLDDLDNCLRIIDRKGMIPRWLRGRP
jgi:hypothetical protein